MSCALLENAKSQYKILRFKPQISANTNVVTTLPNLQDNATRVALKRPAPNKPTSTVIEMQKRFFPDNMIIKTTAQPQQQLSTQMLPSVATIKATLGQSQPTAFIPLQHKIQQQQANVGTTQQQQQPPRRQIFWNTAHISTTTKFVLDVQANQAFGFSTEGKERLASKHPELIRYLPDNEDRDWLIQQQIIPQQNHNSRFLFLIHDEVSRLYQSHDVYKTKSSIDLSLMMTFTVPDFMIQKMKIFFVDLNIKSRGLITNSYSMAGATAATMQQQQSQQQQQCNSHLRNALLLGTQTSMSVTTTSTSNVATTSDSSLATSSTVTTNVTAAASSSSNITSTENLLQHKTKSSNLSSSHATLTALLNNSSATSASSTATNEKTNLSSINSSTNLSSSNPTLLNKLRK